MKMMSILCLMIILHSGLGNPMAGQGMVVPKICYTSSPQYMPHDTDCRKFYQCSIGQAPVEHICASPLRWSTTINNCDYPHNVPCPRKSSKPDPCSVGFKMPDILQCDKKIQGWEGSVLLRKAAKKGNLDEVKQLVEHGANITNRLGGYGYSPLHEAAGEGHLDVVKYLQSHGADIFERDSGLTPLWLAAHNGHLPVVEYLADSGAPLDTPSAWLGQFPLNAAAGMGNVDVVRFLIERGADVNKKSESWGGRPEQTSLEIAREWIEEWSWGRDKYKIPLYEQIITLLIDAGAQEA